MALVLRLHVTKDHSELTLLQDGVSKASKTWPEQRDMGQQLFVALRDILTEQKLQPQDIADFQVESELPEIYTSARIAETVKRVYTFGIGGTKS